ncbi:MAG: phosphate acyltransferase PlsX [Armatimonadota bacterium]|nr:phosphate acyltransferase PlsX [Armatimonadota bacterium]MDR7427092.1 phosphate acyltransferase PlsX [Armatimonadota bacterium]MDR7465598.1 phosphate acyltransferase PlsX [Armatimonadota bacterium]MDR7470038.1 phosphate acyltransferase PlsX [Armatimonadota bacterium]MDR7474140.1 phosphate acyltransferase PlsX [Armatimonadota bacterium]
MTVRIAVDGMGGDYAPEEVVAGAVQAASSLGVEIVLAGPVSRLAPLLRRGGARRLPIEVVDAPEVIEMHEPPAAAVRRKRRSSIHLALQQVREGRAAAAVSAGNTGAVMGAALLVLGRIPAVERPAIGAILPTLHKTPAILLDVGANVDCKPRHLLQFGVMGHVYAHRVLGIPAPRVALLSNGEEANKGNEVTIRAADLLRASGLNFIGNVEGRDFFTGLADVVVCDGFVGNIVLKFGEGLALALRQVLRDELGRAAGKLLLPLYLAPLKWRGMTLWRRLDYREYGGAPLLGVGGIVIVAHGRSNAWAIRNAIRVAAEAAARQLVEPIAEKMAEVEGRMGPVPATLGPRPVPPPGGAER